MCVVVPQCSNVFYGEQVALDGNLAYSPCDVGLQPEALSLQSLFVDAGKHIPGSAKFKNVDEMVSYLAHVLLHAFFVFVRCIVKLHCTVPISHA